MSNKLKNLARIVEWYKKRARFNPDDYSNGSLEERIRKIYTFPHQRRVKKSVKDRVKKKLLRNAKAINKCKDFNSLYNIVEENSVKGFGDLSIYDTTMMIGFRKGILPDKVYLHRGTRRGAEILLGRQLSKTSCLLTDELDILLRKLKPYQIEDLLCICKDDFKLRKVTSAILNKRHGERTCVVKKKTKRNSC
ncbi:MAG: hypothetical protein HY811_06830 [Planctomycetes bacterium]|nr:hypothetical protein [Planctomycetota bacterium]